MNWLNDFNSTNGKILASIFMAIFVVMTVCLMEVADKHFNEILLLELLSFIAAWAGISYVQFAKKRDTYKPAYPADEDGPAAPAPVSPAAARAHPEAPLIRAVLQEGADKDARLAAGSHFGERGIE